MRKKEAYRKKSFMYEFGSGETSEISLFVNDDFPSEKWWPYDNVDMPKNMAASLLDATRLKGACKEKKLKGKLEKLAATLDEDDNPVLMIVAFK